jgi:hypothetical protein
MELERFLQILKQNENKIPVQMYHIQESEGEKRYNLDKLGKSEKHQTSAHVFRVPFLKTF